MRHVKQDLDEMEEARGVKQAIREGKRSAKRLEKELIALEERQRELKRIKEEEGIDAAIYYMTKNPRF